MADVQHKDLPVAELHEPKQIAGATTSDAGKVITPSPSTAGAGVLRFLASSEITFDNTGTGLSANDVAAALAELAGAFDGTAANVTYDNTASGLIADDVQDAIDELAGRDELTAQSDITDLAQTISDPPTQAEVQAISDKVDAILAALRSAGVLV